MKRLFDFTIALIGLILLLPVIIVVCIAIKLSSPGKIFFSQRRLTKGAKEFDIYKFRSMTSNEAREKDAVQIKGSSSEITPIGRILRKTKIDEIPQLWNILKGDMSIIGPRPELPRRLKYYSDRDKRIFEVRSGVSSPASIVFSDEEYLMNQVRDPEEFYLKELMPYKIDLNIYYVDTRSFFGDIWLIIATGLKILGKVKSSTIVKDAELLEKKNKIVEKIGVEY